MISRHRELKGNAEDFAFVASLKNCAMTKDSWKGTRIHADILERGLLGKNPYLASSLINMYVKCGMLSNAQQLHEELPMRSVVSWNALITGYAQHGQSHEALDYFQQMLHEGFTPDGVTFISVMKACANVGDIDMGKLIHDDIIANGLLEKNISLGTSVVDMFAKLGMLAKAKEVLRELPVRDAVAWSVIIVAYTQQGRAHEAIACFDEMQCERILPDVVTYICIMKACGSAGVIDKGKIIHGEIISRNLLHSNAMLATALVDMYAKCGALDEAQKVHDGFCEQSTISWNALISGYAQHGKGNDALKCFERMHTEGFSPDAVTCVCILKACGSIEACQKGKQIHSEILCMRFLDDNVILGTMLVDMYVKLGMLTNAEQVLQELPVRDLFSWSALISGYSQQGYGHETLNCFKQMRSEGFTPNAVTFMCILKACAITGDIVKGKQIHEEIVNRCLLQENSMLGTALLDMYAKCGFFVEAQQVFEDLAKRDVVSWSALIMGYAQHGRGPEALNCLRKMQSEGCSPNEVTFVGILIACSSIAAIDIGKKLHAYIARRCLLEKNVVIGSALVHMYAKCGMLLKAQHLHNKLSIRNVISWNSLISGCIHQGKWHDALYAFESMQSDGFSPDCVTFLCILMACGSIRDINTGEQIYHDIVAKGFLRENIMLGSALVDMYTKCNVLVKAQRLHDELSYRSVISWNALISGYSRQGQDHEALECFEQMQNEGFSPDCFTFVFILKACSNLAAFKKGTQIHNDIIGRDMLDKNVVLGAALVDMYVNCGLLEKAAELLQVLPVGEAMLWNALITGYAEQGRCHEALDSFQSMQNNGLSPIAATFVCILKLCGSTGAVDKGKQIHDEVVKRRLLEKDVMLATAVVDMYAKCGALVKAVEVLETLPVQDIVCWNALMAGYAQQGQRPEALSCLEQLQIEGLAPDSITYLCVLSACSHSGFVEEAQIHFEDMTRKHGIVPNLEHQLCMVMVLGNAGQFERAMSIIQEMSGLDRLDSWLVILGACKKWKNVKLGRFAFYKAVQCDRSCAAAYVLMANIYVGVGKQKDAEEVEAMREESAWKNREGRVWDNSNDIHSIDITNTKSSQSIFMNIMNTELDEMTGCLP